MRPFPSGDEAKLLKLAGKWGGDFRYIESTIEQAALAVERAAYELEQAAIEL